MYVAICLKFSFKAHKLKNPVLISGPTTVHCLALLLLYAEHSHSTGEYKHEIHNHECK